MMGKEYFVQRKVSVVFVILLLVIGSIVYFTTGVAKNIDVMSSTSNTNNANIDISLFKNTQLKVAYTDEGTIDIFALAKNNDLSKVSVARGNPIPEVGGMVLGAVEGEMMQEEGEFKNIGDTIVDYDLTFRIDGVLEKTGTFADDFHFISNEQYTALNGESNVLLIKFKDETTPKLFFIYDITSPPPIKIELADGSMNLFYKHVVDNKIYYPLIIGSKEAKMMQEEKLFTKTGDTIDGFFDKDVIIVGIMQETNTGMDMMHIVEKDFFEKTKKPIEGIVVYT